MQPVSRGQMGDLIARFAVDTYWGGLDGERIQKRVSSLSHKELGEMFTLFLKNASRGVAPQEFSVLETVESKIRLPAAAYYLPWEFFVKRKGLKLEGHFETLFVRAGSTNAHAPGPCTLRSYEIIMAGTCTDDVADEIDHKKLLDQENEPSQILDCIARMISAQEHGEDGHLQANGQANVFFRGRTNLHPVVTWDRGYEAWVLNVNSSTNPCILGARVFTKD